MKAKPKIGYITDLSTNAGTLLLRLVTEKAISTSDLSAIGKIVDKLTTIDEIKKQTESYLEFKHYRIVTIMP